MFKKIQVILYTLFFNQVVAQSQITGLVYEIDKGIERSIPGATIYWLNGKGSTVSDVNGGFFLSIPDSLPADLIFSFPGFTNDTVSVMNRIPLKVYLKKSVDLKQVDVNARKEDLAVSTIKPLNSEKITQRELLKAACCNLSEAFETNPSVNVSYKDAVTGVKEIQLLGLDRKSVV